MLIRKGIVDLSILDILKDKKVSASSKNEYIILNDVSVKITSQRYAVFKKSIVCSCCGLEGKFFAIEKNYKDPYPNYHLNLYGYDEKGKEVLITKDHIIPKSKGGKNHLSNYQTMCINCNVKKGNKI
jgi:hypothetical protein